VITWTHTGTVARNRRSNLRVDRAAYTAWSITGSRAWLPRPVDRTAPPSASRLLKPAGAQTHEAGRAAAVTGET
jgi:hypothetical protein